MAKNVYKFMEILSSSHSSKIDIKLPEFNKPIEVLEGDEALFDGKTIEELKHEAEEFEKEFIEKKQRMLEEAEKEREAIINKAKDDANFFFRKGNDDAMAIRQQAEDDAKNIIEKSRYEARIIESEVSDKEAKILKEARVKGYQDGFEEGYKNGAEEVKRLIERVQIILNSTIEKRNEIFIETESQIINLVLLVARKVIKVISENQKNVVINNVIQALRKLKSRGDVVIRVNLADIDLTTQHKKDFVEMVEGVKSIRVMEDSTIDKGGCIIETDFGTIDARISSQLQEIQEKIVELMPIQTKDKQDSPV